MESKEIKVKFINGRFVPLNSVNFEEGEVMEIEILSQESKELSWRGSLKNLKKGSVDVQHENAIIVEKSFAKTWFSKEEDEAWKGL